MRSDVDRAMLAAVWRARGPEFEALARAMAQDSGLLPARTVNNVEKVEAAILRKLRTADSTPDPVEAEGRAAARAAGMLRGRS